MANETPNLSHEQALAYLKAAKAEGNLSATHQVELAGLLGTEVRLTLIETFAKQGKVEELVEVLHLEDAFVKEVEKQIMFQLLRSGEKMLNFDQVLKTFTPEMLVAACDFQNPKLVLTTKGRSFKDLVAAMDAHKTISDQENIYVNKIYNDDQAELPLENWGAYIVDGAAEMAVIRTFDNENLTLGERLKLCGEHQTKHHLRGMDRWIYAQLIMQALKDGEPIDAKYTCTILDGDPALSASHVPDAGLNLCLKHSRVRFSWNRPESRHEEERFRRSVGGDVPC
jgi:hypothetical protein